MRVDRLYSMLLHPDAREVSAASGGAGSGVSAARYVLFVSFRRDGRPVPTPLWFAPSGGALYVRTDPQSGKVKRIRRDPRVLLAAANWRGKPLGDVVQAQARLLTPHEHDVAERALADRYGFARRVYRRLAPLDEAAYIELRIE
jgi:PPOX class probable F420-dependent enzyme